MLCPNKCSGHGKCDRGCRCASGWGGWGCWTEIPSAERDKQPPALLTAVAAPAPGASCATKVVSGGGGGCVCLGMWRTHATRLLTCRLLAPHTHARSDQITDAAKYAKNVALVVVLLPEHAEPDTQLHPALTVVRAPSATSTLGERMNLGLARVTTPFVTFLFDDISYGRFSDVPAMVQTMQQTDLDIVGGMVEAVSVYATRSEAQSLQAAHTVSPHPHTHTHPSLRRLLPQADLKHLLNDCYQMNVKNWTLSYVWGYKNSMRGCMVCDAVSRWIVTRTQWFGTAFGGFDKALDREALLPDVWLRAQRDARVAIGHCPQLQVCVCHRFVAHCAPLLSLPAHSRPL